MKVRTVHVFAQEVNAEAAGMQRGIVMVQGVIVVQLRPHPGLFGQATE